MRKVFLSFLEIAEIFIICFFSVFLIRHFLVQPFLVSGESMSPNFRTGDYVLTDELTYRFRNPERGDVVVFKPPVAGRYFIKRIIGLPGEKVKISRGKIFIENKGEEIRLSEPYLSLSMKTTPDLEIQLKKNEYFVLGDNRRASYDSRFWGPITRNDIIGRVKFRLWPLTAFAAF